MSKVKKLQHAYFWLSLFVLGMEQHSGQWSKGYRMMCYAQRRLEREHNWNEFMYWQKERFYKNIKRTNIYKALLPKAERWF
jgi:hypothetical protein